MTGGSEHDRAEDSNGNVWIVGCGQFGRRAVDILLKNGTSTSGLTVVDILRKEMPESGISFIQAEGVQWFIDHFSKESEVSRIIPSLPVHLAAEWVKGKLQALEHRVVAEPVPEGIISLLPNPHPIGADSYAVSYAQFLCPPDCPEPEGRCMVTDEKRPLPLYALLESLRLDSFTVLIVRSHQFAPGVGGFLPIQLWDVLDRILLPETKKVLLCTACSCHGVISCFSHAP